MEHLVMTFLIAVILCGIVGLVVWGITAILPTPPVVKTVLYVVGGVICLLILLRAITGGSLSF